MDCHEAEPFVSALYDGETIPPEAGEHIQHCLMCRAQLTDYSKIDAELRLLASTMEYGALKPPNISRPLRLSRFLKWQALTSHVRVPRLAIAAGLALILALVARLGLVNAQNRGSWFQFELHLAGQQSSAPGEPPSFLSAQAGYKDTLLYGEHGGGVGAVLAVDGVEAATVRLAIRARRFEGLLDSRVIARQLGDLAGHTYLYVPGQTLQIPVEGGGTLLLTGQVFQQRPLSLAWGFPVSPSPHELVFTRPALARGDDLLAHLEACAMTVTSSQIISLYIPKEGLFIFSLYPFDGAVQGDATWGQLKFSVGSDHYILFSASPITGGDQPRTVWVCREKSYLPPSTYPAAPFVSVSDLSSSDLGK